VKASIACSGRIERRGQGSRPWFEINLEPETAEERALLRVAQAGLCKYRVWDQASAEIQFVFPRISKKGAQ
jgi:hypothetical protein